MKELRQTGRTTRMIQEAILQAKLKHAVYIFASSNAEAQRIQHLVDAAWDREEGHSIRVERVPEEFDWILMSLHGASPNCVFLVDHAAIEVWFGPVLEMLHRYDRPAPQFAPFTIKRDQGI